MPRVIGELRAELERSARRPIAGLSDLVRRRLTSPYEIIDWAKHDARWSYTLAEVMTGAVSRPRDLAARLVIAILAELEAERETFGAETAETIPALDAQPE